jgi:Mn2+/Fe2+ NRAMP family transporter
MVTGAANADPSLVLTATVAGAAFHYSLLWVVVLCVPFLLTIFAVSGRIGHETHRGLVDLLREHHGNLMAMMCAGTVLAINMAMIIADLMAVTDGLGIIMQQPRVYFTVATAFSIWYILIFHDYRKITRWLLWLSMPLYVYVAAALVASPPWMTVLRSTFVPAVPNSPKYVLGMVALFGSLLTPYVIVWQTSSRRENAAMGGAEPSGAESYAGTAVTTLLSYCIIVAAGTVLRLGGNMDLTTQIAANALRPAVGDLGPIVFAVGIIGAGLVALPVLVASMCYSLGEAMGWKTGLSEHPWDAARFYVMISAALFIAAAANFFHINPVKALYWSQILAGILIVPILVFILVLANDRRVMRTINTRWQNFWIGAAAGGLTAATAILIFWSAAQ